MTCNCTEYYTCQACALKKEELEKERAQYGCLCRACNEYNEYAYSDKIIDDGKFTCWSCKNHPERRLRGLPREKVKELDKK